MIYQTSKKLLLFFVSVFFGASPTFFVSAQSSGAALLPDSGVASTTSVPTLAETTVVPATSTSVSPVPVSPSRKTATPSLSPRPIPAVPFAPKQEPSIAITSSNSLPPKNTSSFPYALVALAIAFVLAPYGVVRFLNSSKKEGKKEDESGNKCGEIKQLLERKKSTLGIISGTISLKQALVDFLTKKIEEKKEELATKVTAVVIDEVVGEEGEKIVESAKKINETYETLVENLEQARKALEYFTHRRKQLTEDVGKIEIAHQTCLLGGAVFDGVSGLSRGLEIFEAGLHQKLYRYTSREKDVFSRDAVLATNLAEMAEAGKWLPSPELPENIPSVSLRFFLTEKGKEEYEKVLLPLHKKYLSDISYEESDTSKIEQSGFSVVYEDEWQVIAKSVKKN